MRAIRADTGRDAVLLTCRELFEYGASVSPRGQKTLEVAPLHLEIANPRDVLPTGINRAKLLPAIAAAEALQNVAGVAMPGLMSRISSFFPKPSGRWGEGVETYGPRLGSQLADVVDLLRGDPDSREAVATIWREGDIVGGQAHNLCTVSLQFLIRGGRLNMLVNMRSNDAWYGLCYDLFQFAAVQLTVALCLDVPVGRYFHSAASMHLYERHWEVASKLCVPSGLGINFQGIGHARQPWAVARNRAHDLLNGRSLPTPTATERWYADTLRPYFPDGT